MRITGIDHVLALAAGSTVEGKLVLNASGAIFGPVSTQHRDLRAEGIAYADDYKGNALAAMLGPGKIEVRFHRAFTDEDVARLLRALAAEPGLAFLRAWRATYQGRALVIDG